jgi:putative transposase
MEIDPHDYPWDGRTSADQAEKNRRRSLRLQGYDYAQADAYFITICTQDRACLFGEVVDGSMSWNAAGQLAATMWIDMSVRFPDVELDAFVVMPDHIHGIIVLPDRAAVGAPSWAPRTAPQP